MQIPRSIRNVGASFIKDAVSYLKHVQQIAIRQLVPNCPVICGLIIHERLSEQQDNLRAVMTSVKRNRNCQSSSKPEDPEAAPKTYTKNSAKKHFRERSECGSRKDDEVDE